MANNKKQQKTVAVISLGCSKNLVDTEIMLGELTAAGYVPGVEPEGADIVIVNTCGFIRNAVLEAEENIATVVSLKKSGYCGKVVVAGCLAEREKTKLRERFPQIDLIIGSSSYANIAKLLNNNATEDFQPLTFVHGHKHARLQTTMPWTAYLKIADGCSNRCAYCLIPSLRGDYRSVPQGVLLDEAAGLAAQGVKELCIVAQDTTRYGRDLKKTSSFTTLITKLSEIEQLRWIRLLYAYPEMVDEELVSTIAGIDKICNYIDIPIQHISDDILRAMGRRGGSAAIRKAIGLLRQKIPGVCIRTTVMVGFPGETTAHFEELMDFIEETRFDRLGVFEYSPEEGTPAASFFEQIPGRTKSERAAEVMDLQYSISEEINNGLVGTEMEVLVEELDEDEGEVYSVGRTYRDAPEIDGLFFLDREETPGTFVKAKVNGASEHDLRGE